MTDPVITAFLAFFREPTLGIPLLLTLVALVAWILAAPGPERRLPPMRRTWFPPAQDLASRIYYALADGEYSRVLSAVADRLDSAVRSKRGRSLYELPLTRRGARRLGIPEAPQLRRAVRRLSSLHARALEREGRFSVRWRFWRTAEEEEARFLNDVDSGLSRALRAIDQLEGTS